MSVRIEALSEEIFLSFNLVICLANLSVKEKIGKVATRYDQIQAIDVVLSVIKNPAAEGKHIADKTSNF